MPRAVLLLLALVAACAGPPPRPSPRPPTNASANANANAPTNANTNANALTRAPSPAAVRVLAGTSGDYPPLSVARGDRFEGFAPALLTAFAAPRGLDLAWSTFRWTELAGDLRAGRFEVVADGITVRPERSIAGRFTVPIARGGAVLLLRRPSWAGAGAELAALDRPELRVAVNRGAHLERVTRERFKSADVRAVGDNAAVREALARGEVDAAMTNTFEAPRWTQGLAGIERIGPITSDVTALWVRADREELGGALDDWLLGEEESGRLAALRARELGEGAGPKAALAPSALSAAIAERLALMPLVAAAKQRAGLPIEDAAQEERVLAAARAEVERAAKASSRAAPPASAIDAFFRLQIQAAKATQARAAAPVADHDLARELRPAIARVTSRQCRLLVRLPRALDTREMRAQLGADLGGLDEALVERLASAIAALAPR